MCPAASSVAIVTTYLGYLSLSRLHSEVGCDATWGSCGTFRSWALAWRDSGHKRLLLLASKQDPSGQWARWAAANAVGGLGPWVMLVGRSEACCTSLAVQWQLPVLCTGHWGPGRTEHQFLARLPRILALGNGKTCTRLDAEARSSGR